MGIAITIAVLILVLAISQFTKSAIPHGRKHFYLSNFNRKAFVVTTTEASLTSTEDYPKITNVDGSSSINEWSIFEQNHSASKLLQIPLADRVKFGKELDPDEFLRKYVINSTVVSDSAVVPVSRRPFRKGGRAGRPHEAHHKKPGVPLCRPMNMTVTVQKDIRPLFKIFPKCVTVERCGGCCNDDTHVCEAVKSINVKHTIRLLKYVGNSSFVETGKGYFNFTQDTECACKCRTRPEHCKSPNHIYRQDQCSCVCVNSDEHKLCEELPDRIWNNDKCSCECMEKMKLCSSGLYYNTTSCDCLPKLESAENYDNSDSSALY